MHKRMAALMATAIAATGMASLTASPAEAADCHKGTVIETVQVRIAPNPSAPSVGTRAKGSTVCIYATTTGEDNPYTACGIHSSQWVRISSSFVVPPKWVAATCIRQL